MKRKITDLEQKLINDGWCLAIKRYTGKHSEKTHRYEYHKTSDIRNNGKSYEQVIELDQKRSQIVDYGIKNIGVEFLNSNELTFLRALYLMLDLYVKKLGSPTHLIMKPISKEKEQELIENLKEPQKVMIMPHDQDLTNEEIVESCEEIEKYERNND